MRYLRPAWETAIGQQAASSSSAEVAGRHPAVDSEGAAVADGAAEGSAPADGTDPAAAPNGRNGKHKTAAHSNGSNGYTTAVIQSAARNPQPYAVDRTPKLYIGGKQARPDSGYSRPVHDPAGHLIAEVGEGNRKDIRNAV